MASLPMRPLFLLPLLLLPFAYPFFWQYIPAPHQDLIASTFQDVLAALPPLPFLPQASFPTDQPCVGFPEGFVTGTIIERDDGAQEGFPRAVEAFLGVPYAQPPVGDRRLRPLEGLEKNASRDVDATRFGPICPGKQLLDIGDTDASEDCLTVNIFRPRGVPKRRKLPVAVYVHGGAFNRGSAKMHNTASMVGWSEEPFIGVSFNYRIGALGFLPSALTAQEGILNLGLRDQVFLFDWVQENIGYFGGDRDSVTLIGLSAGAHSIGHHVQHQSFSEGPTRFHRAVIESGAATARAIHPPDAPLHEEQFRLFVAEAGCGHVDASEVIPCLRRAPSKTIINASARIFDRYNPSLRWAFQPVIDGAYIRGRPIDLWEHATTPSSRLVPILTGHNTNEGSYYVPAGLDTSAAFRAFWATLLPHLNTSSLDALEALYPDPAHDPASPYVDTRDLPALGLGAQFKRVEQAYAHYAYACPVRQTALYAAGLHPDGRVWAYHWALNKTVRNGANHADNMAYETLDADVVALSPAQRQVAGYMHAYVTSFITRGDPNAVRSGEWKDRPVWETAYKGAKDAAGRAMVFGMGNDERAGGEGVGVAAEMEGPEGYLADECAFWWRVSHFSEE